jgi:protein-S-isoprenylcysteine O-methyltransferase Ste14
MARMTVGKALYGLAFTAALPALLVLWSTVAEPNVALPAFGSVALGLALALSGLGLVTAGMGDLWRFGGGLPMNAFPPPRFVPRGVYRWLPHPIYTGFVLACLGTSMAVRSRAGLWLVTPAAAFGCAALVLGYERLDLKRRFGETMHLLPADEQTRPSQADRIRCLLCAVIPWVGLYELTVRIPAAGTGFRFGFEDRLPVWSWTIVIYESLYVAVAAAPWCARTQRDLRALMVSAWVAMAIVFPVYWVLPSSAPRRGLAGDGWIVHLLRFERNTYPPVAAFPSFHVLWAVFVARLYRLRWIGIAYAAAVSASCITTGMHYIADVAAALLLAPAFMHPQRIWERLRAWAEGFANSWREWRIGPVRIVNHGAWAGLAAFVQVAVVIAAAGPARAPQVLTTAFAGLVGAAVWAQWVEGSSRLRRPFGFYGGFIAVAICSLFFPERWILLAGHCLAAPWMQAIGRVRCLVNGCCHGGPASANAGIRVVNGRSRVTRLANLTGVPIHATQLYSILGNVLLGSFLLRLWVSGCPLAIVCGVYAIGSGCARFIEEAYRGEPQTRSLWGLRMYQWIAAVSVLTGALVTALASPPALGLTPSLAGCAWAAVFALLAGAAMGVDFPESDRPFARLT